MKFDRASIAKFKSEEKRYISWRKHIKPFKVRDFFYNSIRDYEVDEDTPIRRRLNYCDSRIQLGEGIYRKGLKYVVGEETYYMFWSTDSYWSLPKEIFVGKLVNGSIHLIGESFNGRDTDKLRFVIIPQSFVDNVFVKGELYQNTIFANSAFFRKETIFDKDIECLKTAYDGVRAFSKLIKEIWESVETKIDQEQAP